MECPNCDFDKTKVIDSRPFAGAVYRRRICTNCNYSFWTEESEILDDSIIKEMWAYHKMCQRSKNKRR